MNPDQKMQRKKQEGKKERNKRERETRKKFSTHFNRKSSAESEHDSLRETSIPKLSKIWGFFSKNGQIFLQKWQDFLQKFGQILQKMGKFILKMSPNVHE